MRKFLEWAEWIKDGKLDYKEIAIDVALLGGIAIAIIYIYEWLM